MADRVLQDTKQRDKEAGKIRYICCLQRKTSYKG